VDDEQRRTGLIQETIVFLVGHETDLACACLLDFCRPGDYGIPAAYKFHGLDKAFKKCFDVTDCHHVERAGRPRIFDLQIKTVFVYSETVSERMPALDPCRPVAEDAGVI